MKRTHSAFVVALFTFQATVALADFCEIHDEPAGRTNPLSCKIAMQEAASALIQRDHPTMGAEAKLLKYDDVRCEAVWWPNDATKENMANVTVGALIDGQLAKYIVLHLHFKRNDHGEIEVRTPVELTRRWWKSFRTHDTTLEWKQAWCDTLHHTDPIRADCPPK